MTIQRFFAAAVPLLLVLGHGGTATADEPWSALTVSPTTVQAGESVHMTGYCRVNGYPAAPSVFLYWADRPAGAAPYTPSVEVSADSEGAFDIEVPIEIDAPSGSYVASLTCYVGDVGATDPLDVRFAVEGGSDPVITTTTTSSSTSTTVGSTVPSTLSVSTLGTVASPPAARPAPPAVARRGSAAFTG